MGAHHLNLYVFAFYRVAGVHAGPLTLRTVGNHGKSRIVTKFRAIRDRRNMPEETDRFRRFRQLIERSKVAHGSVMRMEGASRISAPDFN